jgi:hypothetical protein
VILLVACESIIMQSCPRTQSLSLAGCFLFSHRQFSAESPQPTTYFISLADTAYEMTVKFLIAVDNENLKKYN